ncbi:metal ABC transporter permease [Gemmobacter fulvus]|uniref:metal ABC transporter permease n=1 Tax=Gemmobacter fulvus TaxID=2840474 RepID=UPI0027967E96|nr:metal ABC transporter permease [Gemmobacter fulvus]MDQ1849118.1 metal ABC transporter permease [Gemmobacter fulvus]
MNGIDFLAFSAPPMLIAMFAAMACALPGNFLLLRRQALLGDAISHVVLPGIVLGFLATGTASTPALMGGAALAALAAVALIEGLQRIARIEPGAAMGVTFTAMFAAGVLALELSGAGSVHLDVEHALYGNLESLIWFAATDWSALTDPAALAALPPELPRMVLTFALLAGLLWLVWRPLALMTFDEGFARSLGLPVRALSMGLIAAAAMAAVAAFAAVGSILTIAMLICPPAAARLCTNRLATQIWLSLGFAALSALLGYVLGGYGPLWLGLSASVSAAGMIAVVSGLILALCAVFGPARRRA